MSASITTQPSVTNRASGAVASAASAPATNPDALTKTDIWSIVITVAAGVVLAVVASVSAKQQSWILIALSVGALGGLVHEIAQSGGKILFFERKLDGIYLGSLAGAVLGAVAGLLAIRGLIINPADAPAPTQLIYEALLAGIAMKGITEAAGGQALPAGSQSVTPGQAMAAEATVAAIASGGSAKPALPALGPLPDALLQPLGPLPNALPADI